MRQRRSSKKKSAEGDAPRQVRLGALPRYLQIALPCKHGGNAAEVADMPMGKRRRNRGISCSLDAPGLRARSWCRGGVVPAIAALATAQPPAGALEVLLD